MRKALILILSIIMLITLTVGCAEDQRTAKQIVLDSIDRSVDINSMDYSGELDIVMGSNDENKNNKVSSFMQFLNKINITFNGEQVNKPLQVEINTNVSTDVQGTDLSLDVPIIAKDDLLYFKIPVMLQPFMSKLNKEYLAMDISNYTIEDYKVDSTNLLKIIIDDLDDSNFIKEDKNLYSVKGIRTGNVVTINITQDNLKPFVENFVIDGLPELIKYLDKYSIAEEQKLQLKELKSELDNQSTSIDQLINNLRINKLGLTNIYDNNGFLRKIIFDIDIVFINNLKEENQIAVKGDYFVDNLNKKVKFEMRIPTKDQIEMFE